MKGEALALVRAELGVDALVRTLAEQDPTTTLVALEAALEQLDDDELRRTRAKVEGLASILEGLAPDDLEAIDLSIRHETLERARAQLWRVGLETQRAIGHRLAEQPATPGRPRNDDETRRRLTAEVFGLNTYRAGQLVALAQLEPAAYDSARAAGLVELARGKSPTLARLLRAAAADGEAEGDEWSTPPELVELARYALGGRIGVDVASHYSAQAGVVRALIWYSLERPRKRLGKRERAWASALGITAEDWARARDAFGGLDGLADQHGWYHPACPTLLGNPPYSRAKIGEFFEKLRRTREAHPDLAYWWLTNNDPAKSDHRELASAGLHCTPDRRVAFLGHDGTPRSGNSYAQVVFAGGDGLDRERFRESHRKLGPVYQPAEPAVSIAHVVELGRGGKLDEGQVGELLDAIAGSRLPAVTSDRMVIDAEPVLDELNGRTALINAQALAANPRLAAKIAAQPGGKGAIDKLRRNATIFAESKSATLIDDMPELGEVVGDAVFACCPRCEQVEQHVELEPGKGQCAECGLVHWIPGPADERATGRMITTSCSTCRTETLHELLGEGLEASARCSSCGRAHAVDLAPTKPRRPRRTKR